MRNEQSTYLILTTLNTLAASFIWGVNTLFLLDAGLSNVQAFAANAFFTFGQVLFEIPTGIVADTFGRRLSYLIGTITLFITTLLYLLLWTFKAPFFSWAIVSALLGLGFTFFSGAVDAWLVDALNFTGFKGSVDEVFAKGQVASGAAMLIGSAAGGLAAQKFNLGMPYILRCTCLIFSFAAAWILMRDLGFKPIRPNSYTAEVKQIFLRSFRGGLKLPAIRWMMLTGPFLWGVMMYGFYAAQPLLIELYGDTKAYGVAGLVAAVIAGSQIAGGLAVPLFRRFFTRRSTILVYITIGCSICLAAAGLTKNFIAVLVVLSLWGLLGSAFEPIRRAYLNQLINSKERATVLSFDGLLSSAGGVVIQPILGRSADVWGYSFSFVVAGLLHLLTLPFVFLVRRTNSSADQVTASEGQKA